MLRRITPLALVLTLLLPLSASADPPEDLLQAMEVSLTDCFNITSDGQDQQRAQIQSLGIIQPQMNGNMSLLAASNAGTLMSGGCDDVSIYHWGADPQGNQLYDLVNIEMDCVVPSYANSLGFSFYFFSREYPDYVGSVYNDTFQVHLTSAAWNGNIVFDGAGNVISVNNALFTVTNQALLLGTGFDCGYRGGGTGWLTTIAPVVPDETIHLRFEIYDMSDGIYDSAVLVDDFYWSETDPKSPTTGHPVELWFLSPKEGPVEGGTEVFVYGKNFTADTRIYFAAQQVGATLIDSGRMKVITPEWDQPESITVMADNSEFTAELEGAYTYVEGGASGDYPPEFFLVQPDEGAETGGETVEILGENFVQGSTAFFGGLEAATTYVSATKLTALTPAHEPDTVEVLVFNPDGQYTDPSAFFTFQADATGDDDDSAGDDDDDDPDDCSCSTLGSPLSMAGSLAVMLAGLGLLAIRRRS